MPNWCSTQFTFHGAEDEILSLHTLIENAMKSEPPEEFKAFGNAYLGNIWMQAGLKDYFEQHKVKCRGSVLYLDDIQKAANNCKFKIDVETAWNPEPEFWNRIFDYCNYKSIKYSYFAEEPGMNYYAIYDHDDFNDYLDEWVVDYDIRPTKDERYYGRFTGSQDEMTEYLQDILETDETDFQKLLTQAEKINNDNTSSTIVVIEIQRD